MTFFNRKQDVLKLELTPYGRDLLSKGMLKPHYYAFYDDDILYDPQKVSQNGGTHESNSQIKGRILTGSVYLKPVVTDKGVETRHNDMDLLENLNYLPYPIGTNRHNVKRTSAWDISLLHNEISSSNFALSSSTISTINVPQINCEVEYTMSLKTTKANSQQVMDLSNMPPEVLSVDGDFYIDIEEEQILFYIKEKNAFRHKDSLSVEVFLYDYDEVNLKKLDFFVDFNNIVNDMLIESENPVLIESSDVTANDVEYFLDFSIDSEVPNEDICSGIKNLKNNDIFLDLDFPPCPDREKLSINIYDYSPEEIEECEE